LYSDIARSGEYIRRLIDFIRREYGVDAVGVYPAKRGFYGETWKLCSTGRDYFVKIVYPDAHKHVYERSLPAIGHMNDHGIDFIGRIVKNRRGGLSGRFDGAVLGVFDWIDGENREDESTKTREYQMLAIIYAVPTEGLSIPREGFSANSADAFFRLYAALSPGEPIRSLFEPHRAKIEHRAERLRLFSGRCRNGASPFFITHGDAGGNYVTDGEKSHIVDWDTAILAPPERDAWFCMSFGWAMDAFHGALRQNGIGYALQDDRLAYYCYHMFFYYMNAYLDRYAHTGATQGIVEYMGGWIEESFRHADKLP
jgi:hypothetical protein